MIRLGIVGCNYGRAVQLPAFRADSRCRVVALAGSDAARTAELARQSDIPEAYGDWAEMIGRPDIDAVAIAVPPAAARDRDRGARAGKPVFVEKPMAADLAGAAAMPRQAGARPPDGFQLFTNHGVAEGQGAARQGAIGRLRHIAVTWNVENDPTRLRLKNWKTTARTAAARSATSSAIRCTISNGSAGRSPGFRHGCPACRTIRRSRPAWRSLAFHPALRELSMSCASFPAAVIGWNFTAMTARWCWPTPPDYMRGFALSHARRPDGADPGRNTIRWTASFPAMGASRQCRGSRAVSSTPSSTGSRPGFAEGYRVQVLLDAVRRSHELGRWLDIEPEVPCSRRASILSPAAPASSARRW